MNLTELDKCNMFERMNDKTFVSVPCSSKSHYRIMGALSFDTSPVDEKRQVQWMGWLASVQP